MDADGDVEMEDEERGVVRWAQKPCVCLFSLSFAQTLPNASASSFQSVLVENLASHNP